MGEIIDKTEGKINQAVGDVNGNKGSSERARGTNARLSRRPSEGCEVRGQQKNPKLTRIYNKVMGGNYHGYYNAHHHRRRVDPIVRRGRRLLVE